MKKVILLKGLQGSGKSTWAREQVEQYPGRYKIINKDALRAMLDGGKWSKHNEQFVLTVRNTLILQALQEGFHLLIDDTNLHPKHEQEIRELVKGQAEVEIKDFTDVPIEVCIERDLKRPNSVGERVIRQTWRQFLYKEPAPPEYIEGVPDVLLVDVDGTLAILGDRSPYDEERCDEDTLNEAVARIVRLESRDTLIIVMSGRTTKVYQKTAHWLFYHSIPYHMLLMRQEGDKRRDSIVKQELYEQHIRGKYNVRYVLDDRNQCIDLWRRLGLTALQVAEGDF